MTSFKPRVLALLCILTIASCGNLKGCEELHGNLNISHDENYDEERLDVTLNDLLFLEHGIYLINAEEFIPLKALYTDSKGLFVMIPRDKIWNECNNGHRIYHQACGGCANWWCAFRCKCYSPW